MRCILIAPCAFVALTSYANADGVPVSLKGAPSYVEQYSWSAFCYFGGGGGFSRVDRSGSVTTERTKKTEKCDNVHYTPKKCSVDFVHVETTVSSNTSGIGSDDWNGFGTLQIGYDRLFHQHMLIGAFADVDLYEGDSSFWFKDGNGSADLDWVWSVGGRLGTLVTPRVLLYGVGGYTQAR